MGMLTQLFLRLLIMSLGLFVFSCSGKLESSKTNLSSIAGGGSGDLNSPPDEIPIEPDPNVPLSIAAPSKGQFDSVDNEIEFKFQANKILDEALTINWGIIAKTAQHGVHINATTGSSVIAVGQSSVTLAVPILSSAASALTFEVKILSVSRGTIQRELSTGTIPAFATPPPPVVPSFLNLQFKQVTGGRWNEACGLTAANEVYCWGHIYHTGIGMQVGLFPNGVEYLPGPLMRKVLTDVRKITALDDQHTCALNFAGRVYCWGGNWERQLGSGRELNQHTLTATLVPELQNVEDLAAGSWHTCALTQGDVYCWGQAVSSGSSGTEDVVIPNKISGLSGIKAITASRGATCAINAQDRVQCWGLGTFGQLGNGSTNNSVAPVQVMDLTNVKSLSSGMFHYCSLNLQNNVHCWGQNSFGQLGIGSTSDSNRPRQVTAMSGVQRIMASRRKTCATNLQGATSCWGVEEEGPFFAVVGQKYTSPQAMSGYAGMLSLAADCAVLGDQTLKCWGTGRFGKRGMDGQSTSWFPLPTTQLNTFTQIATGKYHACSLNSAGEVWCRGANTNGQLGNGTTTSSTTDVRVSNLSGAKKIAVGLMHSCAINSSDQVVCWGWNSSGQLGNNSTSDSRTPVTVSGLSNVKELSLGASHGCALTHAGSVHCWGSNNVGQIGNSTTTNQRIPVQVITTGGATQVALGYIHSCALMTDETVKCWGGFLTPHYKSPGSVSNLPATVSGLTAAEVLVSGEMHSCALQKTSGQVFCWGRNDWGQLGEASSMSSSFQAKQVQGLASVKKISAGYFHNCAILSSDEVSCWGKNTLGQLGSTTVSNSATPLKVEGPYLASDIRANFLGTFLFVKGSSEVRFFGLQPGLLSPNPSALGTMSED